MHTAPFHSDAASATVRRSTRKLELSCAEAMPMAQTTPDVLRAAISRRLAEPPACLSLRSVRSQRSCRQFLLAVLARIDALPEHQRLAARCALHESLMSTMEFFRDYAHAATSE